ncbi:MAG: hypothetical protein Q4G68_14765 [Planctomycetia bacterium]|nr:hypothetical protein [Planctomycetia bacterium]
MQRGFAHGLRGFCACALATLGTLATFWQAVPGVADDGFTGPAVAKYTRDGSLPDDQDSFLVRYDITPYTSCYPNVAVPSRPLIQWILFDTGPDFWFQDGGRFLTATNDSLIVRHGAKVQQYVSNVVDRFVTAPTCGQMVSVRILLFAEPASWREGTADLLRPWPVQSEATQGWLLSKEETPAFLSHVMSQGDFRELNASRNTVPCGETYGWVYAAPCQSFIRDYQVNAAGDDYARFTHEVDSGYRFELTPLLSTQGDQMEFLIRCDSTVVAASHSFNLKVATSNMPRQQLKATTPQIVQCQRQDKVSFPVDQICVLDLGMVPLALSDEVKAGGPARGLGRIVALGGKSVWYNVLVIVEAIARPGK